MSQDITKKFSNKGYLVNPKIFSLPNPRWEDFINYLESLDSKPTIITPEIYTDFIKLSSKPVKISKKISNSKVSIIQSYEPENKKRDIIDWIKYYNNRYESLKNILLNRSELRNAISIPRLKTVKDRGSVTLIGIVNSVQKTAKGNILISLEDQSSTTKILINPNKTHLKAKAEEIVPDEVIGIVGVKSGIFIFVEDVFFPDMPDQEIKKSQDDIYAAFISDVHVGSNMFLPDKLSKFISWMKGEVGNSDQKKIAQNTKYLFVTGDLVDGVGVYPNQEKELIITDVFSQYEKFASFFSQVPEDVNIIICPGNHDALKLSEPQHALFKDIAKSLYELPNVHMVSNPSMINIHNIDDFPGFNVLMYHGYSIDHYVANVERLRTFGGYDRVDIIMKFLLQKRHLAPTHSSTLVTPTEKDYLIIDKIPDIFTVGHIHKAKIGYYKNVVNICSSCWQGQTAFQEKVGHTPEPGRVPIFNLKTRAVKMLRFA